MQSPRPSLQPTPLSPSDFRTNSTPCPTQHPPRTTRTRRTEDADAAAADKHPDTTDRLHIRTRISTRMLVAGDEAEVVPVEEGADNVGDDRVDRIISREAKRSKKQQTAKNQRIKTRERVN